MDEVCDGKTKSGGIGALLPVCQRPHVLPDVSDRPPTTQSPPLHPLHPTEAFIFQPARLLRTRTNGGSYEAIGIAS